MKRNTLIIAAIVLLAAVLAVSIFVLNFNVTVPEPEDLSPVVFAPEASEASDPFEGMDVTGPCEVERVVDGDTIITYIDGERVRVRALCIDTPESVAPEETGKKNTEEGLDASKRAKELLEGQSVYLEFDEEMTDQYDRYLAYIYLEDGRMFEEIMISEGLAKVVYFKPNKLHRDELYELQDLARESGQGFWGTGFFKNK